MLNENAQKLGVIVSVCGGDRCRVRGLAVGIHNFHIISSFSTVGRRFLCVFAIYYCILYKCHIRLFHDARNQGQARY
jgi:hypothetical protein